MRLLEPKEDILGLSTLLTSEQSCMLEYQAKNRPRLSRPKESCSKKDSQGQSSSLTLDLDSISKDANLSRYWNRACKDLQSKLWLPHQTESHEVGSPLYVKPSNFTEEKFNFWKTLILPKVLTPQPSLLFSLPSVTPRAESEVALATRKIRLYPKNEETHDLLSLHRRAYNLAIERFKTVAYKQQLKLTELRRSIKEQVKSEWGERKYEAEVAGDDVRIAFKTRSSIIQKRKKGLPCDYKFKSVKEISQFFVKQRLRKTIHDMFFVTEDLREESYGKTTIISCINGRKFVNSIISVETSIDVGTQELRVASIDPGVRTFAALFSPSEVKKYGEDFYKDKVMPLLLKLDKILSNFVKFKNEYQDKLSKYYKDTCRFFSKKTKRLRYKINDFVEDLHKRVANDILCNCDVIVIPDFPTQEMSSKLKRKIRTKTVRS